MDWPIKKTMLLLATILLAISLASCNQEPFEPVPVVEAAADDSLLDNLEIVPTTPANPVGAP
ncbi:MAG: hypothetical protein AAF902_22035, partial [Chloroflexota bacterium]